MALPPVFIGLSCSTQRHMDKDSREEKEPGREPCKLHNPADLSVKIMQSFLRSAYLSGHLLHPQIQRFLFSFSISCSRILQESSSFVAPCRNLIRVPRWSSSVYTSICQTPNSKCT